MPRTTFAGSLIDGASNGLGRLAQSIAMGQRSYQDGFDQESTLQSRLAQAIAQQTKAQSDAQKTTEETRGLQLTHDRVAQLPQLADEQASYGSGSSVPLVRAVRDAIRNGTTPTIPGMQLDGPNPDGSAGVPALVPQDQRSRITTALQRSLPVLLNDGKVDPNSWSQSLERNANVDLRDDVLAGRRSAADVGKAQAAEKGTAQYSSGSDGQVLDLFGGGVNVNNPVAQAGLGYKRAQSNQANAAASASSANARKADAETGQIKDGPKGTYDSARGVLVNPRDGTARDVLGPDGKPLGQKLKDIPPAQNTALIENTKALSNIDDAIKAITSATGMALDANGKPYRVQGVTPTSENALGARNLMGDDLRQRTDPEGVPVRAKIANIAGARFHDLSGAAVSVGEAARLKPFIPDSRDGPGPALQKLANLRREYQLVNDQLGQYYGPDNGYRAPPSGAQHQQPGGKRVVRTGTDASGRRVAEYDDGSIGYAD